MLNKIDNRNASKQVRAFVKEAKRMVNAYGWQNRVVYPYSFPMKVTEAIEEISDYDCYTNESKAMLRKLANGLADVLNSWESYRLS